MIFTIETVVKMTGIPAASLRNWEKRYGFPTPQRTEGGHRFYTAEDVSFLKSAVCWVEEGHALTEIARRYREKSSSYLEIQRAIQMDDIEYRTQLIYKALLKFDQLATLQHYQILNAKLSPEQLFDGVFTPVLRHLSQDWEEQKITTAQERFACSFIRLKLSTFLSMDFPPTQKARVMAATLEGEKQEGGLMLLAAHMKFRGYPLFYFGTELPASDLHRVAEELEPDVICLSYSDWRHFERDMPVLRELKVSLCISGKAVFAPELKSIHSLCGKLFHFCQKTIGSEAAQLLEMICQSKTSLK